ncbi:MAG: hypothetical protein WED11_10375 [Natronospirillum sp.]
MNPILSRILTPTHSSDRRRIRFAALALLFATGYASADLMLHPTRIVLSQNQRAGQLEVINNSSETVTYRITLVNRRMSDTGSILAATDPQPGELFADSLLRYSPRQVTLLPGAGQIVRLMVRKPGNLADGEYRSHLLFTKQPAAKSGSIASRDSATNDEIGIVLNTLVGVSIPVIVRHGETAAEMEITQLDLQNTGDAKPMLNFQLARAGNQSAYGDLTVTHISTSGRSQVLARVNGVAVYVPNSFRQVAMALAVPDNAALNSGTLRVTFREQAKNGGGLLAEAQLILP